MMFTYPVHRQNSTKRNMTSRLLLLSVYNPQTHNSFQQSGLEIYSQSFGVAPRVCVCFPGELTRASPRSHEWRKKVGAVVRRTKEAAQKSKSFRRLLNDFSSFGYSSGLRGHRDRKTAFYITTSIVKKARIHLILKKYI